MNQALRDFQVFKGLMGNKVIQETLVLMGLQDPLGGRFVLLHCKLIYSVREVK